MCHFGRPDLFINFNCNPKYPDIAISLEGRQQACNRPDVCRVFKVKRLMDDIHKKQTLGKVSAYTYTIKFQKRGLPHAHILIILDKGDKIAMSEAFDETVRAYIPVREVMASLYDLVNTHMLHTKCGTSAPCFRDGSCRFQFPKAFCGETLLHYRGFVQYRRPDIGEIVRDEVTSYLDCVSSHKACWRLLSFKMADKISLSFDWPFTWKTDNLFSSRTMMWQGTRKVHTPHCILPLQLSAQIASPLWHQCCASIPCPLVITYVEFPQHLCWMEKHYTWKAREKGVFNTISQIHNVSPQANEELLCLRLLLHNVRGPISFEDLRTVHHTIHPTYKLACLDLLLLDRDDIYQVTMYEAARWSVCLRVLFPHILFHCNITDPLAMYNNLKPYLLDDMGDYMEASDNRALMHIKFRLGVFNKTLADYRLL
ncbi:hypothetical protein PR048_026173 [Dryococelus australis]|uniref:Helitron helicase-like domain-containing protein n=1 Tax=Dryococelus australis TaxID=614101 RepID=A0ABQ9GKL8_9NEOP|nr:hypothetical protein PR048_026173 [Dryococelus australis]